MHLEEFAEGASIIHRLDPRVKFLCAVPLVVLVASMYGVAGPFASVLAGAALSYAARLDPRKLLNRLAAVNVFVLVLWAFLPFSVPGYALFSIGPLSASRAGVAQMISITLKTNAIVLITISVLGTTEIMSLAHALVHLRVPRKLVYLFFFFYRYISVLHEEYLRLRRAMALRCFRPRTDRHTYRAFAYLAGMLLVRSHDRSRRIYDAMLCRGFRGHFPVASHFHLHVEDIVFAVIIYFSVPALWAVSILF